MWRMWNAKIRTVIPNRDLDMIVSNIGITPDLSTIYTSNSAMHNRVRAGQPERRARGGELRIHGTFATQAGERLASGERLFFKGRRTRGFRCETRELPAPLDIQVERTATLGEAYAIAQKMALQLKGSQNVSDVLIPPGHRLSGTGTQH